MKTQDQSTTEPETKVVEQEKKKLCLIARKKVEKFLDSAVIQIMMTIVTLYALIGDDLRLIYAPKMYDYVFTNLTITSLFLFSIEICLSSFGYENYLNSFFFWLDLVSTASLITDIEPIMNWVTGSGTSSDSTNPTTSASNTNTDSVSIARASRGAKIGSKAGRLTRVIRIIRLVRIVKLYKSANHAIAK
jgi:hypothetical protein